MKGALVGDRDDSFEATTTALARSTTVRMRNTHGLSIVPRISRSSAGQDAASMPRRIPWRIVGVAVAFLFVLGWGLAPSDRRRRLLESVNYPVLPAQTTLSAEEPPPPKAKPQTSVSEVSTPVTFETDPDRAKTVHCTAPYKPRKALVQWALMIDAGSTGSRIHIYKFNNCRTEPAYEYEVFRQTQPGLSAFPDDPAAASRSLNTLLDAAITTVPPDMHHCTPIAVKATAGLRLLGPEQSDAILKAIHAHLVSEYPFHVVEKDGVVIMDGKDEGVYAWITANYLLDTLSLGPTPYAVLDLGGASTQIVYQPTFRNPQKNSILEGEHKYLLRFGGYTRLLYQHSYLGYGLMRARERVHQLVTFLHPGTDSDIPNPCLARGMKRTVTLGKSNRTVTMVGADIGGFEACNRIIHHVLAKDAPCPMKPCSFAGVYHPSLKVSFPQGKILLLSYFYDRISPLLPPPANTLSVGLLAALAARVCGGQVAWDSGASSVGEWRSADAGDADAATAAWTDADSYVAWGVPWSTDTLAELAGRPEYCLDLTFMHALLRGYGVGVKRDVRVSKQVNKTELGWCLGAAIGMLEGVRLQCVA